jgi:hypothetical protein
MFILADEIIRGGGGGFGANELGFPIILIPREHKFVPGTEQNLATPPSLNMPIASMVPAMIALTVLIHS